MRARDWLAKIPLIDRLSARLTNRAGDVTARLIDARNTGESLPTAAITMAFRNGSAHRLSIRSYRVRWPGGVFTARPRDLDVPPGAEVGRTAKLDASKGDIGMLLDRPEDVTIEVVSARAR